MIPSPSYLSYIWSQLRLPVDLFCGRILPALRSLPKDLTGKTAIVTGSNVEIGLEAARALAIMGCTVILACRDGKKADTARLDIINSSEGKVRPGQIEVQIVDLSDLQSVSSFIDTWGTKPLDILINNAGITVGSYTTNPQGFELTYATNVLSHYLLTLSLLPSMNYNARIVSVSSISSYSVRNQFDPSDLDHSKILKFHYHVTDGSMLPEGLGADLYGRSKLLQIFFTRELQNRLDKSRTYSSRHITAHVCHPGLVKTTIWKRETGASVPDLLLQMVDSLGISSEQGAITAVHLATSDEAAEMRGRYWDRMAIRAPNRLVEDNGVRAAVWEKMAEHCQLSTNLVV